MGAALGDAAGVAEGKRPALVLTLRLGRPDLFVVSATATKNLSRNK